jgi:hypothetical protein
MGCFDYECECGGTTCKHVGRQLNDSVAIVEVPLSDGTTVYLQGDYDQYGSVNIGDYEFYPEQFDDYFEDWFNYKNEEKKKSSFLAKRIWTVSDLEFPEGNYDFMINVSRYCFDIDERISSLTPEILKKCILITSVIK